MGVMKTTNQAHFNRNMFGCRKRNLSVISADYLGTLPADVSQFVCPFRRLFYILPTRLQSWRRAWAAGWRSRGRWTSGRRLRTFCCRVLLFSIGQLLLLLAMQDFSQSSLFWLRVWTCCHNTQHSEKVQKLWKHTHNRYGVRCHTEPVEFEPFLVFVDDVADGQRCVAVAVVLLLLLLLLSLVFLSLRLFVWLCRFWPLISLSRSLSLSLARISPAFFDRSKLLFGFAYSLPFEFPLHRKASDNCISISLTPHISVLISLLLPRCFPFPYFVCELFLSSSLGLSWITWIFSGELRSTTCCATDNVADQSITSKTRTNYRNVFHVHAYFVNRKTLVLKILKINMGTHFNTT